MMATDYVKENVPSRAPLPWWSVAASLAAVAAAFGLAALVDRALPAPLSRQNAPPDRFIAETAYEHLVNLTNIGPRVAGSYENEVAAVGVLVNALKAIAREASPHNVVEVDLQRASGGFSLTFFDGMNNVYRDVQNVVARARAAGGRATTRRTALLLNCHFDTVPDSPGASDDAAGCAVGLEVFRALAAGPRPLRHDVLLLLNGAEENIMQASHAFITNHRWASSVRAFINMEACGAGGREVLFQATPHDPWIVEVYASAVPHPFATSMAQEMFESGLIPADTDFRIFRDFGKLSGVDLAWSSDGYAYHTRLDAPARVPPAALQRTGDNVLALATGLLSSPLLESGVQHSGQPVFFDLMGMLVVVARGGPAAIAAVATLMLLLLRITTTAKHAQAQLYISRGEWYKTVLVESFRVLGAIAGGAGAAAAVGMALHVANARLLFYAQPGLLVPLFVLPAFGAMLLLLAPKRPTSLTRRGYWGARAAADALALLAGGGLAVCLLLRLRSGYVPFLWVLLPTVADLLATATSAKGGARAAWWAGGYLVPVLQSSYLARDSLAMLVPLTGRAPAPPLPIDVVMGVAVAGLALLAGCWLAPVAAAASAVTRTALVLIAIGVITLLLGASGLLGGAYSLERPQRLMVFHVQRHIHPPRPAGAAGEGEGVTVEDYFWVPELDANTAATLDKLPPQWRGRMEAHTEAECSSRVYCGSPYCLPVRALVPRAHRLPAHKPTPEHAAIQANVTATEVEPGVHLINLQILGPSHVVVIISPVAGGVVEWCDAVENVQEASRWGERRTYFISLHAARAARNAPRDIALRLRQTVTKDSHDSSEKIAQISIAGHSMSGERGEELSQLFDSLPNTVAATGWPVHIHLYSL